MTFNRTTFHLHYIPNWAIHYLRHLSNFAVTRFNYLKITSQQLHARVCVIVIFIVVISMVHLTVTVSGEWNTFCGYNRSRIIDIECRTCEIKHWSRPLCYVEYRSALYRVQKNACIASHAHRRWINIKIESVRIKSL